MLSKNDCNEIVSILFRICLYHNLIIKIVAKSTISFVRNCYHLYFYGEENRVQYCNWFSVVLPKCEQRWLYWLRSYFSVQFADKPSYLCHDLNTTIRCFPTSSLLNTMVASAFEQLHLREDPSSGNFYRSLVKYQIQ